MVTPGGGPWAPCTLQVPTSAVAARAIHRACEMLAWRFSRDQPEMQCAAARRMPSSLRACAPMGHTAQYIGNIRYGTDSSIDGAHSSCR